MGLAMLVCAAGVVGFGVRSPLVCRYERVTREGGSVFLSESLMQRGYAWVDVLAGTSIRYGISANAISWLALGLGLAAGGAATRGWMGLAAWALLLSGIGDAVDGAIARRQGTANVGGEVLDSALDRYVEFFMFCGLLIYLRGSWVRELLVLIALFGGFMVTYSTAKAEAVGVIPSRGWMKRPERLVWLIGGAALSAAGRLADFPPSAVILGALAVIAFFSHISAIHRLRSLRSAVDGVTKSNYTVANL